MRVFPIVFLSAGLASSFQTSYHTNANIIIGAKTAGSRPIISHITTPLTQRIRMSRMTMCTDPRGPTTVGTESGGLSIESDLGGLASAPRDGRRKQGGRGPHGRGRPFGTPGGPEAAVGPGQQNPEERQSSTQKSPGGGGFLNLPPAAGPIVDIGVNLCHKSFQRSLPEIVKRALTAGVTRMIITGTSERASAAALELANDPLLSIDASTGARVLFSTAGVHPHDAKQWTSETKENVARMHENPACVAMGECGLDFNRNFSPPHVQEAVFEEQVRMAVAFKKPLFCHEREAHSKFLEIIDRVAGVDPRKVCVHCFTGNLAELQDYVKRGFYVGFTGCICDDKRGKGLRELLTAVPLAQTMIETDAPFMMPTGSRGRNEPSNLPAVLRTLAMCHGVSEAEAAQVTTKNAIEFFGLS